jgi:hypothetical protein
MKKTRKKRKKRKKTKKQTKKTESYSLPEEDPAEEDPLFKPPDSLHHQNAADMQARITALATYMGHASAVSTQHYLVFLEPFAEATSDRFARHCATFLAPTDTHGGAQ